MRPSVFTLILSRASSSDVHEEEGLGDNWHTTLFIEEALFFKSVALESSSQIPFTSQSEALLLFEALTPTSSSTFLLHLFPVDQL